MLPLDLLAAVLWAGLLQTPISHTTRSSCISTEESPDREHDRHEKSGPRCFPVGRPDLKDSQGDQKWRAIKMPKTTKK